MPIKRYMDRREDKKNLENEAKAYSRGSKIAGLLALGKSAYGARKHYAIAKKLGLSKNRVLGRSIGGAIGETLPTGAAALTAHLLARHKRKKAREV